MKHNKEKEEREKVAQKFFSHERRALYDIMPRGRVSEDVSQTEVKINTTENKARKLSLAEDDTEVFNDTTPEEFRRFPRRSKLFKTTALVILVAVIAIGAYAIFVLPKASIDIILEQKPWAFHDTLLASLSDAKIPLQIFTETKNIQISFPASGNKNVSRKARGTINVCNAFNSDPQTLVATTRFLGTNNIIFRLDAGITVPGATIATGKIQPKCIEAQVSADKPGADSNVGPINKWYIPGFKGSPKYDGFYGVSGNAMTGGLVGASKVPTIADIAKVKQVARESIRKVLDTAFLVKAPQGIIIITDNKSTSSSFAIIKEAVIDVIDASGNAQYFIEARDERVGVGEANIKTVITEKAKGELGAEFELADSNLDLNLTGKTRDASGAINSASIMVDFTGGFIQPLTAEEVKMQAAGKTEAELSDFIPTHKNFKAHITLWPFWVSRVPSNQDKITVKITTEPLDSSKSDMGSQNALEVTSSSEQ